MAAYINDIVIYSKSWVKHRKHIAAVLRALKEAGLMANPTKCRLAFQEVKYLGYTVGRRQLQPLVDKV